MPQPSAPLAAQPGSPRGYGGGVGHGHGHGGVGGGGGMAADVEEHVSTVDGIVVFSKVLAHSRKMRLAVREADNRQVCLLAG